MKIENALQIALELHFVLTCSFIGLGIISYVFLEINFPSEYVKMIALTYCSVLIGVIIYNTIDYIRTIGGQNPKEFFLQKIEITNIDGLQWCTHFLQLVFILGLSYQIGLLAMSYSTAESVEYFIMIGLLVGNIALLLADRKSVV